MVLDPDAWHSATLVHAPEVDSRLGLTSIAPREDEFAPLPSGCSHTSMASAVSDFFSCGACGMLGPYPAAPPENDAPSSSASPLNREIDFVPVHTGEAILQPLSVSPRAVGSSETDFAFSRA